jgi:UDP-3-O-[3-hydroxymyristoyl] glucosamine N-acyltransferase
MNFSDLIEIDNITLIQDGTFSNLGYFNQKKPAQLSFIQELNDTDKLIVPSNISSLIIKPKFLPQLIINHQIGIGFSENPHITFIKIHNHLASESFFYGSPIDKIIGRAAHIHPTAFIADTNIKIGNNCHIGPNVTILEGTQIANNVIIRAGTTVGSEPIISPFYDPQENRMLSSGGVIIYDNVEIHSNCCISKAVLGGFTEIGEYTKIDNLVNISSDVKIGKRCMIVALASIGESVIIGDDTWIGPGSAIEKNIEIGNNAYVTLGSIVTDNVQSNQRVSGNFAIPHEKFLNFLKKIR